MKPDQERVRSIIHNTIISLCENGLKFDKHLRIEGVIGVTTDEQEIFLIHLNESLNADSCTGGQPFRGGRPPGSTAPRPSTPRPSAVGAFARARPPFQYSPNSSMGIRGFARGSPRMNFGSPRMLPGIQQSPVPFQGTPVKSPRNPLDGMPRLQRFSPKPQLNSPDPPSSGKRRGLLSLPAPLTKEVSCDPGKTLPPKQLFLAGQCRNSGSQFPQISGVPCKPEKMDVILVDDDEVSDFVGKGEESGVAKVEFRSSPGHSLPDLEPETFPAVTGEMETGKDTEVDTPVQSEPKLDDPTASAGVPGCSGIASEAHESTEQDEKSSTRASLDNGSLTSFEMGFSLDKPFNPEDYATEGDKMEDWSFTDPSDEDWKSEEDTTSDPDWSKTSPRRKKSRVTPRKMGLTPKQVTNTPSRSRSKLTQKFGRFTQVPQSLLNSASGEEDSWKIVARFVCNISGCNVSFSQKYNLRRHQRAKHGVGRATKRSKTAVMPDLDRADNSLYPNDAKSFSGPPFPGGRPSGVPPGGGDLG